METYQAWAKVPENLKTKTQITRLGKRLARGQQPVAEFESFYHGKRRPKYYKLYDVNEAVDKMPATPEQLERLAKGRATAAKNSRCPLCQRRYTRRLCKVAGMCERCYDGELAKAWATMALDNNSTIILDTETTGLDGDDQIVEIAIVTTKGEILLNTLVWPTKSIPADVVAIHGISDAEVKDAPLWSEIWPQVLSIFQNARVVVIWNAPFDTRMMAQSCAAWGIDYEAAIDDLPGTAFVCAMRQHAKWFGEWNYKHNDYRWQALNGGHRALGDCLTVIERLKEMRGE